MKKTFVFFLLGCPSASFAITYTTPISTTAVLSANQTFVGTNTFTQQVRASTIASSGNSLAVYIGTKDVSDISATQFNINAQTNIAYSAAANDAYIQVTNTAASGDGAAAFSAYNGFGATALASFGASYSATRFGHAAAGIGEVRCNTQNGLGIGTSVSAPVWIGAFDDTAITISTNNDVSIKTGRSLTVSSVTATVMSVTSSATITNATLSSATINTTLVVATITVTGGSDIRGTSSSNAALAGNFGEYKSSAVTVATNYPNNGVWGDLAAVVLTPGAWLVSCHIIASGNITGTEFVYGISSTSGNSAPAVTAKSYHFAPSNTANQGGSLANIKFEISSQTTVYLKYQGSYTVGTPQAQGEIRAFRFH